jgi:hypothetical protein
VIKVRVVVADSVKTNLRIPIVRMASLPVGFAGGADRNYRALLCSSGTSRDVMGPSTIACYFDFSTFWLHSQQDWRWLLLEPGAFARHSARRPGLSIFALMT